MKTRLIYVILLSAALVALAGCGGQGPEPTPTPTKTAVPVAAAEIAPTMTPSPVPVVATATPAPPPAQDDNEIWSTLPHVKDLAVQVIESGGMRLEIERVRLFDMQAAIEASAEIRDGAELFAPLREAQLMGALSARVTNVSDERLSFHPAQATVVVGSEQVTTALFISDDVGGEFFPGVMKEGAIIFLLNRTTWADIAGGAFVLYEVMAPSSPDDFSRRGDDFFFEFALTP